MLWSATTKMQNTRPSASSSLSYFPLESKFPLGVTTSYIVVVHGLLLPDWIQNQLLEWIHLLLTKVVEIAFPTNFVNTLLFWQNPNIFTSFSPQIFLTIFFVKSKLSAAKKYKTTTFSRVFHPKKNLNFLWNQSWIFGQKMKISNRVNNLSKLVAGGGIGIQRESLVFGCTERKIGFLGHRSGLSRCDS